MCNENQHGKADDNGMNEEKTLEDILNEAAPDTKYIHLTFQQGVVVYGIALDEGRIVGATGNVIAYNDAERARFTDEYEQRKLQGVDVITADDFPEETRRKWEHDYVINTLADVLAGGPISSYSMYSIDAPTEGVVFTDPMEVQDALRIATDEANKRVDEFSRIGLAGVSLDSVFFEIADDVNVRDFAAESDVNKLIILASQANANLWSGIMRSGGFLTSEVYARIADDVLSGRLVLVDREGNRLTDEHKPEDSQPVVEAPQYETSAPADDNNASTVERLFVQPGEQPTYRNADAADNASNDNAVDDGGAADGTPVDDTQAPAEQPLPEQPQDASDEGEGTTTEPDADTDDNTVADDAVAEPESSESDEELPKHGDADNDGIANGVDPDPYHADADNAGTEEDANANEAAPDADDNADTEDNATSDDETNEAADINDDTMSLPISVPVSAPEASEFHVPDLTVPTLETGEFPAVDGDEGNHDESDGDTADTVDADQRSDDDEAETDEHESEAASDGQESVEEPAVKEDEETTTAEEATETEKEATEAEEAHDGTVVNAVTPKPYADEKVVALFTTGLDDLDAELGSIANRRSLLEQSISEQDARIDGIHDVERQIGDLKTQVSRLEGMRDSMKDEADSFASDVDEAKAEIDRLDAHEAELGKRSEWLHRAQEVLQQAGLL